MSDQRTPKHKRDWPEAPLPGDDPALDAAMAAIRALDRATPLAVLPPPQVAQVQQDLSIGMGNASEYAEGVPVATAVPRVTASKIKLAADLPRELPAGSATATTGEVDTRALRAARDAAVGAGEDAAITVPKAASPWAAEAAASAVAPMELPSAHAPKIEREPESARERAAGMPRRKARTVIGIAVAGVAVAIFAWVALRGPERGRDTTEAAGSAMGATSAISGALRASTSARVPVAPSVESAAPPPGPAPTSSAAAPPEPSVAPTVGRAPGELRPRASEDPYDAAPPSAAKTVEPVAPPQATVTAPPAAPSSTTPFEGKPVF